MTDDADGSVVLAKMYVVLFSENNNQRLIPRGRPFFCFPDLVTDLFQNSYHDFPACVKEGWLGH